MPEVQNDDDAGADHARLGRIRHPDIRMPACKEVHQRVVAVGDPMKSPITAGWLRGELHAPT